MVAMRSAALLLALILMGAMSLGATAMQPKAMTDVQTSAMGTSSEPQGSTDVALDDGSSAQGHTRLYGHPEDAMAAEMASIMQQPRMSKAQLPQRLAGSGRKLSENQDQIWYGLTSTTGSCLPCEYDYATGGALACAPCTVSIQGMVSAQASCSMAKGGLATSGCVATAHTCMAFMVLHAHVPLQSKCMAFHIFQFQQRLSACMATRMGP